MHRRVLAALTLAALVSGCAKLPIGPPVDEPPEPEPLSQALATFADSRGLSPEALQQRLQVTRDKDAPERCDGAELASAMLLLRLPAKADGVDPESLLQACLDAPGDRAADARRLAMVVARALELRHGEAQAQAATATLKDELAALQQENAQLREQLEGLKAIEESLQQRQRNGSQ